MFKVGDRVKVIDELGGDSRNGLGVIETAGGSVFLGVRLDNGRYIAAKVENIFPIITPPEKITQNGYEYSLVGPVKPEWLVDGVWVVRKDNGETHQINQKSENSFSATSSLSRVTGLTAKRVAEEFRPHEPNDWKWGDWAMYAGRKVFVIEKGNWMGDIRVSHPDLLDGVTCVSVLSLTPTF